MDALYQWSNKLQIYTKKPTLLKPFTLKMFQIPIYVIMLLGILFMVLFCLFVTDNKGKTN